VIGDAEINHHLLNREIIKIIALPEIKQRFYLQAQLY
jgi:hypothetical protein